MNLMITGAMGHIGTYLIKNYKKFEKFKKIILVDNFSNNKHNFLYNFNSKKKFIFFLQRHLKKKFFKKFTKSRILSTPCLNNKCRGKCEHQR